VSDFMEIHPVVAVLICVDRQTDVTKSIRCFLRLYEHAYWGVKNAVKVAFVSVLCFFTCIRWAIYI